MSDPVVTDIPLDDRVEEISVAPIEQPVDTDEEELDAGPGGAAPSEEGDGNASIWQGSFAPRKARPSGFSE